MSFLQDKQKRKAFIIALSIVLFFAILIGACAIYVCDYYKADDAKISTFKPSSDVTTTELEDGSLVFAGEKIEAGFIFYPGGKVEHDAYIPLMKECAARGMLCVLVEMPFKLAVFDINAGDDIREQYPEIEDWYIGGHSLGGSMAASYLEGSEYNYNGLVLLGSYSAADLSKMDIAVLSVYGSEDKVLNSEKYEECVANLPSGYEEIVIDGGCHAYFGMYGAQSGDGSPNISNEEQIKITADAIDNLVTK